MQTDKRSLFSDGNLTFIPFHAVLHRTKVAIFSNVILIKSSPPPDRKLNIAMNQLKNTQTISNYFTLCVDTPHFFFKSNKARVRLSSVLGYNRMNIRPKFKRPTDYSVKDFNSVSLTLPCSSNNMSYRV